VLANDTLLWRAVFVIPAASLEWLTADNSFVRNFRLWKCGTFPASMHGFQGDRYPNKAAVRSAQDRQIRVKGKISRLDFSSIE
jgi:hypothetical protein